MFPSANRPHANHGDGRDSLSTPPVRRARGGACPAAANTDNQGGNRRSGSSSDRTVMSDIHSDALVFFGATGDLATRKSFPRCRRWPSVATSTYRSSASPRPAGPSTSCAAGRRTVSRRTATWTEMRSRSSTGLLRYVDGDYRDPTTFEALQRELGGAEHPAHYLAIPPHSWTRRRTIDALRVRQRLPRRRRETVRREPRVGARSESDSARHLRRSGISSESTITSASDPFTTCVLSLRIRSWRRS